MVVHALDVCHHYLFSIVVFQRCPLDKLILQVKVLDLGEPKAILALALSPPNLDDIERNVLLLKEVSFLLFMPHQEKT